jgi:membrane peptidoglycan carboxypeptidase
VLSRQRPGQPKENIPAAQPERILKPETAIQMRQMMEGVVLHGTGTKAVLKGYTSGGKTGSAQIFDQAAHVYSHSYNASFLGFAPVGNPKIVIAVTLQGTHGGTTGYGGARAAPIFREVATSALRILEVPKDLPGSEKRHITERPVESDLASVAGVDTSSGFGAAIAAEQSDFARSSAPSTKAVATVRSDVVSSVTLPLARGGSPVSTGGSVAGQRPFLPEPQVVTRGIGVPDFRGKTLRDVLQESMAAGVVVEPTGEGLAISQDPAPGASLPPRSPVRVSFRR